jgi:molybdate transport system substrate-binding protein
VKYKILITLVQKPVRRKLTILPNVLALFLISLILIADSARVEAGFKEIKTITVLSAPATATALSNIVNEYSTANGYSIASDYDAPPKHVQKIVEGEAADLFITDQPDWIDTLKTQGMIDVYSRTNLLKNQLIVVAERQTASEISVNAENFVEKIKAGELELVIADSQYSGLGHYTSVLLQKFAADLSADWANEESIFIAPYEQDVVREVNARGSIGIIYASELRRHENLVKVFDFPEQMQPDIIYQAVVVAGENMAVARNMLDFLQKKETIKVFENYGFRSAAN